MQAKLHVEGASEPFVLARNPMGTYVMEKMLPSGVADT